MGPSSNLVSEVALLTLGRLRRILCEAHVSHVHGAKAFPFAGLLPSGNCMVSLNNPPSQIVFSLPGMPHSQFLRSRTP